MFALAPDLQSLLRKVSQDSSADLAELVKTTLDESKGKASTENRKSQWEYLLKEEIFNFAANEPDALKGSAPDYYEQLRLRLDIVLSFTENDACDQSFTLNVLQDLLEAQTIASCSQIFSWIEERSDRLTEGMVPQKGKALVLLRTLNDLLRRLSKTGSTTTFCGRILNFLSGVFPLGERSGVNLRGEYGPQWEGVQWTAKSKSEDTMEAETKTEPAVSKAEDTTIEKDVEGEGAKMDVDAVKDEQTDEKEAKAQASPSEKSEEEKREEFYKIFWSLQLPFSRPPVFVQPSTLEEFKNAVNAVLPVIKEANTKERAMMGSKAVTGTLKRKREASPPPDDAGKHYFFAKFLTSPDLLDLEIADTHFRRQILFQLLVILTHLPSFTKAEKAKWVTPRNRSLQMDFTLESADAKWVQEATAKAFEELRQTAPNGRAFADTVAAILEREKNWIRWKNDLCTPFDKEPVAESIWESTKDVRVKMREDPPDWEHKLGSAPLTEIWENGYRDLGDLQNPFQPGEVKDFVKKVKQEDARIELRKKSLGKIAERSAQTRAKAAATRQDSPAPSVKDAPAPESAGSAPSSNSTSVPAASTSLQPPSQSRTVPPGSSPLHPSLPAKPGTKPLASSHESAGPSASPPKRLSPAPASIPAAVRAVSPAPPSQPESEPTDEQIAKFMENKERWSWLALRTARDEHLHHFSRIGNGDIILLAQEIEKEKEFRSQKGDAALLNVVSAAGGGDERGVSPNNGDIKPGLVSDESQDLKTDLDPDVKMEEQASTGKLEPSISQEMQVDTLSEA